jgi:hypothetical protein
LATARVPQNDVGAWVQHMRRGDFEAAWQVSDAMICDDADADQSGLPRWYQRVWNGTPLAGMPRPLLSRTR